MARSPEHPALDLSFQIQPPEMQKPKLALRPKTLKPETLQPKAINWALEYGVPYFNTSFLKGTIMKYKFIPFLPGYLKSPVNPGT